MTITRPTLLLSLSLVACLIFAIVGWSKYVMVSIDLTLAKNWADTLVELRDTSLKETQPSKIADELEYITRYYRASIPPHSPLSKMSTSLLEYVRSQCISEVIHHLQNVTKDDLGTDPTPWIMKYASKDYRNSHINRFLPQRAGKDDAAKP